MGCTDEVSDMLRQQSSYTHSTSEQSTWFPSAQERSSSRVL